MFSFGIGQAAGSFKNIAWGALLLFYYQQVVGIEAALVAAAIAISVVMDAVTDPIIGAWSDRIKTRWGPPTSDAAGVHFALGGELRSAVLATRGHVEHGRIRVADDLRHIGARQLHVLRHPAHVAWRRDVQGLLPALDPVRLLRLLERNNGSVATALINGYYFPTVEGLYDPGYLNPEGYRR